MRRSRLEVGPEDGDEPASATVIQAAADGGMRAPWAPYTSLAALLLAAASLGLTLRKPG